MSDAPFVLFRVAAGPRIGHGHLRRAEALARTLGRSSALSMRGAGASTNLTAVPSGGAGATLEIVRPAVLVLDDPHARHAQTWASAAARRRIPVVSLHDLGLARVDSTLAIDGSVTSPAHGWPAASTLRGLAYAVIRPPRRARRGPQVDRMLVSLGGGAREALTRAVLTELGRRHPGVDMLVPQAGLDVCRRGWLGPNPSRGGATSDWHPGSPVSTWRSWGAACRSTRRWPPACRPWPCPSCPRRRRRFEPLPRAGSRSTREDGGGLPRRWRGRSRTWSTPRWPIAAWRRRVQREGPRLVDGRGAQRVARAILAVAEAARHA